MNQLSTTFALLLLAAAAADGRPDMLGLTPAIYYSLCTASTTNPATLKAANITYDIIRSGSSWWCSVSANAPENAGKAGEDHRLPGFDPETPVPVLSPIATVAAHLGRGEDLRYILPNQNRCLHPQGDFCDWPGSGKAGVLRNRLTLREGPGAIGAERLGRIVRGVNDGLLQSAPPAPRGEPVISVFPVCPKEWNAEFRLLARDALIVSSARLNGRIPFVEIHSEAGSPCCLMNPWPGTEVMLYREGKPVKCLSGKILEFATKKGETIMVAPRGAKTSPITVPEL